jgi:RNA polymerase sigma factor for flagellar operon FliA
MSTVNARTPVSHREELILTHYPMVRRVAYRMVTRFPSCVEADDLIAIGTLGLIDAVDRFQVDRKISFTAYARIRVQGAILDELRKQDWVPRSVRNRHQMVRVTKASLFDSLGREPTHLELAGALEVTPERLHEVIRDSTVRVLVSMDERHSDAEERVVDTLASELPTPLEDAMRARVAELVTQTLMSLPQRERHLIDLYYYRDLTFREIADIFNVTESRISQLHTRLKNRLHSRLQELYLES